MYTILSYGYYLLTGVYQLIRPRHTYSYAGPIWTYSFFPVIIVWLVISDSENLILFITLHALSDSHVTDGLPPQKVAQLVAAVMRRVKSGELQESDVFLDKVNERTFVRVITDNAFQILNNHHAG